jgi:hypothetical protein
MIFDVLLKYQNTYESYCEARRMDFLSCITALLRLCAYRHLVPKTAVWRAALLQLRMPGSFFLNEIYFVFNCWYTVQAVQYGLCMWMRVFQEKKLLVSNKYMLQLQLFFKIKQYVVFRLIIETLTCTGEQPVSVLYTSYKILLARFVTVFN